MLQRLIAWLRRVVAPTAEESPPLLALPDHSRRNARSPHETLTQEPVQPPANGDKTLLENALDQWQTDDWQSLAVLNRARIEQHPERARLALLSAAAQAQIGDIHAARQLIWQAEEWGCGKQLIAKVLIAGVHKNLGKVAAEQGQEEKSLAHFEHSKAIIFLANT